MISAICQDTRYIIAKNYIFSYNGLKMKGQSSYYEKPGNKSFCG